MTGLRKRVSVSFISVAILLSISGVIAFFELNTLSHDTKSILSINSQKMELAHEMLEVVQVQDAAFIQTTLLNNRELDAACQNSINELKAKMSAVSNEISNPNLLDSLSIHIARLESLSEELIAQPYVDSLSVDECKARYDRYLPIHADIVNSIYDLTTSSFKSMEPRAEQLHRNAYRAVTPVLISLVVMVVIVLLLYYFMIIYCVNPIVRLNRSLGDFITYRLPFVSKNDCNDEMKELQDKLEVLTSQIRRDNIQVK